MCVKTYVKSVLNFNNSYRSSYTLEWACTWSDVVNNIPRIEVNRCGRSITNRGVCIGSAHLAIEVLDVSLHFRSKRRLADNYLLLLGGSLFGGSPFIFPLIVLHIRVPAEFLW